MSIWDTAAGANAEGRSLLLPEGEYLVHLVSATLGPSQKSPKQTNFNITAKIVESGNPAAGVGATRGILQTDKGDYGERMLGQALKAAALAVRGVAANDPRVNPPEHDLEARAAVGQQIKATIAELCAGRLATVPVIAVGVVAVKNGQIVRGKDGLPIVNVTLRRYEEGWHPSALTAPTPAAPSQGFPVAPPAPQATAPAVAPRVWDPPAATVAPAVASVAEAPAPGGNFWD